MGFFQRPERNGAAASAEKKEPAASVPVASSSEPLGKKEIGKKVMAKKEAQIAIEGKARFGVDEAIRLVRHLPKHDDGLVMQVVKRTLEAANIDIHAIIESAKHEEQASDRRVADLEHEITELESRIIGFRRQIDENQAQRRETSDMKKRLMLGLEQDATTPEASLGAARTAPSLEAAERPAPGIAPKPPGVVVRGDEAAVRPAADPVAKVARDP